MKKYNKKRIFILSIIVVIGLFAIGNKLFPSLGRIINSNDSTEAVVDSSNDQLKNKISNLQSQNEDLKDKIATLKTELEESRKKLTSNQSEINNLRKGSKDMNFNEFLKLYFWPDESGTKYHLSSDTKIYSDYSCRNDKEINASGLKFDSDKKLEVKLQNGLTVYMLVTSDGQIVWSPDPWLESN